jgi:hypothetical protein
MWGGWVGEGRVTSGGGGVLGVGLGRYGRFGHCGGRDILGDSGNWGEVNVLGVPLWVSA